MHQLHYAGLLEQFDVSESPFKIDAYQVSPLAFADVVVGEQLQVPFVEYLPLLAVLLRI
mgnify:CR=1 FL=1